MGKLILILVTLIVLASLVLAGCGGTPTSTTPQATQEAAVLPSTSTSTTPTLTPAPSTTAPPTATPTETPKPTPLPAKFQIKSLDVIPGEVIAGETVSITAVIENTGGSEGTYAAILSLDGATIETKEVSLAPGSSETLHFSLTKDTAGTYEIGIGELTASLTVKEKLVLKEMELKYDDGTAAGYICAVSPYYGGHIVEFIPLGIPFTINKIRVMASISSSAKNIKGKTFDLQVLDKEMKVLYSATYPYTKFSTDIAVWVEFDIPNIEVSDTFYIHLYTDSPYPGFHVGADDSIPNEHSDLTLRTGDIINVLAEWPYKDWWAEDKSKVNWMIRVVGTAMMLPEEYQFSSDFLDITSRLNSPELIAKYMQENFSYSYTKGEAEGVKSAEQVFIDKKGACYDHALFAAYCLKKNGYAAWGVKVTFDHLVQGYYIGHVGCVYQDHESNLYYCMDFGSIINNEYMVYGPFDSKDKAAEQTCKIGSNGDAGLASYSLHNIDMETGKYIETW